MPNIDLLSFIFGAWAGGMIAGLIAVCFSLTPFDCEYEDICAHENYKGGQAE